MMGSSRPAGKVFPGHPGWEEGRGPGKEGFLWTGGFQAAGWQRLQAGSSPCSSLVPSWGAPALAIEGLDLAAPQRALWAHEWLLLCSRQEELTKRLDKVLICEWKYLGTSSYRMFLDLPQVNARRHL